MKSLNICKREKIVSITALTMLFGLFGGSLVAIEEEPVAKAPVAKDVSDKQSYTQKVIDQINTNVSSAYKSASDAVSSLGSKAKSAASSAHEIVFGKPVETGADTATPAKGSMSGGLDFMSSKAKAVAKSASDLANSAVKSANSAVKSAKLLSQGWTPPDADGKSIRIKDAFTGNGSGDLRVPNEDGSVTIHTDRSSPTSVTTKILTDGSTVRTETKRLDGKSINDEIKTTTISKDGSTETIEDKYGKTVIKSDSNGNPIMSQSTMANGDVNVSVVSGDGSKIESTIMKKNGDVHEISYDTKTRKPITTKITATDGSIHETIHDPVTGQPRETKSTTSDGATHTTYHDSATGNPISTKSTTPDGATHTTYRDPVTGKPESTTSITSDGAEHVTFYDGATGKPESTDTKTAKGEFLDTSYVDGKDPVTKNLGDEKFETLDLKLPTPNLFA
jgi:hypothetical protein